MAQQSFFATCRGIPRSVQAFPRKQIFFVDLVESGAWKSKAGAEILARYRGCWPDYDSVVHRFALEASPNYSKYPFKPSVGEAMAMVSASTGAVFKLIYILRNPLDAIASFYRHSFTEIDLAWAEQHRRAMLDHGVLSANPLAIYAYAKQLDVFLACIPRESILLISFDELTKATAGAHDKLRSFLGLSSAFEIPDVGVVHSSPERFDAYKNQAQNGLPEALQTWRLSDRHRAAVVHLLGDDVRRLSENYGFDVSAWPEFLR